MGLKKRFRPKEVEIKSLDEKEKLQEIKPKTALSLVSSNGVLLQNHDLENKLANIKSSLAPGETSSTDSIQIQVMRLINNLYQDKDLSLFQLMKEILHIVVATLECESGSLWILEENKKDVTCKVATGIGSDFLQKSTVPIGKGIVGWVAEHNRSSLVLDAAKDDRIDPHYDKVKDLCAHSLVAAALSHSGEVIGVIQVINKKNKDAFCQSDKYLLEDICIQAAMHLRTSRAIRNQQDVQKRLQTFREINEDFSSTMDLNALLSIVLSRAIGLLKAEVGSVWLNEENADGIECFIAEGPTKDKVMGVKVKKGMGIVGWVVENHEPIIVEDCSKDARFSRAMDKKIGFVTNSMITVPLLVKGECIGAIQIVNKKGEGNLFNREDLDLMTLFAASSAMYIKNARLFASEKKAKELSALINIAKEITSTLDIDSVLMSIVNLASNIIPYEKAAISLEKRNKNNEFKLKSVSGLDSLDMDDPTNQEIQKLHNFLPKVQGEILVLSRSEYSKQKGAVPEIIQYMEKYELESFWGLALTDDQGVLGVISMESKEKDMIPTSKKELLSLLISQSTVALRNASLYDTIPSSDIMGKMKEGVINGLFRLKEMPRRKLATCAASVVAFFLLLIFGRIPYNVASNIEILPVANTFYAYSKGNISKIHVRPGARVKAGDLLVEIDATEQILEYKKKDAQRQKVMTEMFKLRSESKIAEYKIKEREKVSLDYELELLNKKIASSKITSNIDGIVISENLDDLIGMPVNFGQELIKVAGDDSVYVQFEIPEAEVSYVSAGQEVKFKVYGLSHKSFGEGVKLASVAGEAKPLKEGEKDKFFMARALINTKSKEDFKLRTGMTGRGKIYSEWRPIGFVLLNKAFRFLALEVFF